MKRFFVFLILGLVISSGVMAQQQQQKTRRVPFLPYAGVTVQEEKRGDRVVSRPAMAASTQKTVFFDKDSSDLRPDQAKNLIQIGKWLERESGSHYYVYLYSSPEVSTDLAKKRGDTVIQALSDFNVGEPIIQIEHRKSPVINPNRVEIHLHSTSGSLGAASSNFGAGSSNTTRSNF
ncbi:MAG: hypothetical protein J6P93_02180 [Alphaproteobacteria bacterium]|nr:hypothetical protein [Alphaproteobacteria bacterium]